MKQILYSLTIFGALAVAGPSVHGQSLKAGSDAAREAKLNAAQGHVSVSTPSQFMDVARHEAALLKKQNARGRGPAPAGDRGVNPNDICALAEVLTVGTECVGTAGTANGATESMPADPCNGFTSDSAFDSWYSFVATSTASIIEVTGLGTDSTGYDPILIVYEGDCGSLNAIGCSDATFQAGTESVTLSTMIGTTYYYRTYYYDYGTGQTELDFTTCVYEAPPAPANDLCTSVTPVDLAVGSSTTFMGNNTGALDTEGIGAPNVWHAFTTTECANVVVDYCGTTPAFENGFGNLFIGCPDTAVVNNSSVSDTICGDGNFTLSFIGLPAGTYYYAVMLDAANNAEGDYIVNVTASACAPAPANDDCAGAVMMTVGADCVPTAGTTLSATESMPADTCAGFITPTAIDVWYSFTATGTSTTIEVTGGGTTANGFDPVLFVYAGDCTGLTVLDCADATLRAGTERVILATTAGTTYYYRTMHYDYGTAQGVFDFTTCVYSTPAGPDNDECTGATVLTAAADCDPIPGTTANATQTLDPILCNDFSSPNALDVFYSFVATTTDHTVTVAGIADFDAVVEFFSDACAGASMSCADDNFPTAAAPDQVENLGQTGLTVGQTYYVRVYDYAHGSADHNFTICVTEGVVIGLEEITNKSGLLIFPNPTTGVFSLRTLGVSGLATIEVFDVTGRTVHSERSQLNKGTDHTMDLTGLNPGNYNVRVTANGVRTTQRLVIK